MSTVANQPIVPIQVGVTPVLAGGSLLAEPERAAPRAPSRVTAVIVTWNRKRFVTDVLQALSRQTFPISSLDVVVIDNAGTDGTLDHLAETFKPERIVDNDTDRAHQPKFEAARSLPWRASDESGASNTLGFASLTLVRNRANMGGCGGFNTGFAFVEHASRVYQPAPGSSQHAGAPDFVWLVDDDVDLPPSALANLVREMEADSSIGIVGSRTCDINDRSRTIETTIYFNAETGSMQDDAPPGHARHEAHKRWVERVGGPRGQGGASGYSGTMDVDVVSACSMLARWKAVIGDSERKGVGFWDHRYFIYCDDADWCLRFAKHGWRVVLSLDAVVFHTPWNLKLTPARIYYANRNRLWMVQKTLPTPALRAVSEKVMRTFLFDSMHAAMHRRQFHARIILQTGLDAAANVGGKTGSDGPPALPTAEAMAKAGLFQRGRRVAIVCNTPQSLKHLEDLKRIAASHSAGGASQPEWVPIVRNDVPNPPPGATIYGSHLGSRLKKQWHLLMERPRAVVVLDQINDFPVLLCSPWTLHIDSKKLEVAQIERDGWLPRLTFIGRWVQARRVLLRHARTVTPRQ